MNSFKENISQLISRKDELWRVLDIKNHTALRGVYCLEKFPTLLLLSNHGQEIKRTVGGRNLTKELFFTVLDEVRKGRSYDLSS